MNFLQEVFYRVSEAMPFLASLKELLPSDFCLEFLLFHYLLFNWFCYNFRKIRNYHKV